MPKPKPRLMTTTLWEYPSQNYGPGKQGDQDYAGATPSFVIWNLLQRYTRPGDLVVDPMAGSGTCVDVARDLGREGKGYDIAPAGRTVVRADARKLPLPAACADFVFIDPPYSDHLQYSGAAECIGELSAQSDDYYREMDRVFAESDRILRPERYLAVYVSDSARKGKPLIPLGFELFSMLCARFVPVECIAVVRHNATLKRNHWHTAAIEGNYFLRGFNHLLVFCKPARGRRRNEGERLPDRRDPAEVQAHLEARAVRR
jgi:DNA modification methylase